MTDLENVKLKYAFTDEGRNYGLNREENHIVFQPIQRGEKHLCKRERSEEGTRQGKGCGKEALGACP